MATSIATRTPAPITNAARRMAIRIPHYLCIRISWSIGTIM
jgi:hypothetical protein